MYLKEMIKVCFPDNSIPYCFDANLKIIFKFEVGEIPIFKSGLKIDSSGFASFMFRDGESFTFKVVKNQSLLIFELSDIPANYSLEYIAEELGYIIDKKLK